MTLEEANRAIQAIAAQTKPRLITLRNPKAGTKGTLAERLKIAKLRRELEKLTRVLKA